MQCTRCGLLLRMGCVCVCVFGTWVYSVQTGEPVTMLLEGRLTSVGPGNYVLEWGQDWMNPFTAMRGDKLAVWAEMIN